MVGLIVAAFLIGICLIPLELASSFLVDWLWFSSIGYLQVFLTSIGAKAAVFFAVFTATAIILWLNGWLAARFARGAAGGSRAVEGRGYHAIARSVRAHARSTDRAAVYRARCGLARRAGRRGRNRQLGHLPAVSVSRAIWRKRPALQQGHRLLSLLATGLYRDQELDAVHHCTERAVCGSDLLGARRHRIRRLPPINVADGDRARLGAVRRFCSR